ncbi:hypothetical protein K5M33_14965, partial [Chromobacterium vaccinii]|nr:hypothetical protein [Chromobacterium vaccinii]
MADHLYRPRPSASGAPLLWLALGVSLLAHLLLLSLGGRLSAPDRPGEAPASQINIRLVRHPAPAAPPTER